MRLWVGLGAMAISAAACAQSGTGMPGAEPSDGVCTAVAQPWLGVRAAESARGEAALEPSRLPLGEPVRLRLHPDDEVAYLTREQRTGDPASFGGLALITIERAGTYRVALEKGAWIDVLARGEPVETAHFGRGPACSGVRKAVEFRLEPGPHVLELSRSTDPDLGVTVEFVSEP